MGARTAAPVTTLLIAVAAGNTVGFYEYFACRAGWWKYMPARAMLGGFCALYIPVGEFLMFLAVQAGNPTFASLIDSMPSASDDTGHPALAHLLNQPIARLSALLNGLRATHIEFANAVVE